MADLPPVKSCTFCGEDARLVDRRKNGCSLILASFVVAGLTGWFFGPAVGLMDGVMLSCLGLYWALRSQRYVYRCRECSNVMSP